MKQLRWPEILGPLSFLLLGLGYILYLVRDRITTLQLDIALGVGVVVFLLHIVINGAGRHTGDEHEET